MQDEESERISLLSNPGTDKTWLKILKTVSVCFLWICFSSFSEIVGTVMPELIYQTNTDYEIISQAVSMRGAGHAIGGVLGGISIDRWIQHVNLQVSVYLLVYTAISLTTAYCTEIILLYILFAMQGTIETILQICGQRIAMTTWKDKAAGPIHSLQIGYGIGALAIPQIVAPYLNSELSGNTYSGNNITCHSKLQTTTVSTVTPYNTTVTPLQQEVNLSARSMDSFQSPITETYPPRYVDVYWMIGGLCITLTLVFFALYIRDRRHTDFQRHEGMQKVTFFKSLSCQNCSASESHYAGLIVASMFLYFLISVPLLRVFSKYIFSYARDGPCLNIQSATGIVSAFWAALTAGRFVAFVASSFIHMKYILQVEVCGAIASTIGLYFYHKNITVLWVLCPTMGFFIGPIIPSMFAWANNYIEVTSTAQIVPQLGAAVGDVVSLFTLGYSYKNYGPYVIWTYQLVLSAAIVATVWVMQILGSLHGERYQN